MNLPIELHQELYLLKKQYWVIGIDIYTLDNFLDAKRSWKSYTLENTSCENAWISKAEDENYFIKWSAISKAKFKESANRPLCLELSGLANINFIGARGSSTPIAETLYFEVANKDYDYLASERFFEYKNENLIAKQSIYMIGKRLAANEIIISKEPSQKLLMATHTE